MSSRSACAGRATSWLAGSRTVSWRCSTPGLLDEVRALADRPDGLSRTAAQALGYKELLAHLDGQSSLDEATALAITRTRQFAVRQLRWFQRDRRIRWVEMDHDEDDAVDLLVRRAEPLMASLTLTKHHGLGNDFLVVIGANGVPPGRGTWASFAGHVCHRRHRHRRRWSPRRHEAG